MLIQERLVQCQSSSSTYAAHLLATLVTAENHTARTPAVQHYWSAGTQVRLDNSVMWIISMWLLHQLPTSCLVPPPVAALPPHAQIVKSPPPEWEASYKAWLQLHQLQHHQLKQYPLLDAKQRDAAGSKVSSLTTEAFARHCTQPESCCLCRRMLAKHTHTQLVFNTAASGSMEAPQNLEYRQ